MPKLIDPSSKTSLIENLLSDGKPHSTFEIVRKVYRQNHASVARIGGLIFQLRKGRGKTIIGMKSRKNPTKYWYMMTDWKPDRWGGTRKYLELMCDIAKADDAAGMYE